MDFLCIDGLTDCPQLTDTTLVEVEKLRITGNRFEYTFGFLRNCVQRACNIAISLVDLSHIRTDRDDIADCVSTLGVC